MATYTPNMQLKKPAGSDYVKVDDLNGNMDVIDGAVGKLTDLTTTDKTTLVAAINEAAKSGGSENVPYIGDNGNWYIYDPSTMQFKDSGKPSQGEDATLGIGTTTTGAAGTSASVVNTGTASAAVFNFTIPRGDTGPQGPKGDTGTGLTILGTYATVSALQAAVTNPSVGDMYNVGTAAPYNIYLWDSSTWVDQGQLQGAKGDTGAPGAAATVSVGTVTTGAAGSDAAVTNSGTENAAVFNFTIPRGSDGASGTTPNLKVGNTTTLAAGSQATVTRRAGSPDSAPIFDFGIPQGAKGDGADITIDSAMSSTSTNPVQNAVITATLNGKANTAHTHTMSDINGVLPVTKGGTNATGAEQARTNLSVPLKPTLLWSGSFSSGSITVPSFSEYTLIAVTTAAGNDVYCLGSKSYGVGGYGLYGQNYIAFMGYRFASDGDVVSITNVDLGGYSWNPTDGSVSHPAITQIYGLIRKADIMIPKVNGKEFEMRVNYSVNQEGRLQSITNFPLDESKPMLDLPNDFDISAITNYLVKDGALHFDPVEFVQTATEKIAYLKRNLSDTDYITAKAVDAMTSADSLMTLLAALKDIRTEYADVLAQRAEWRAEINELEAKGDDA